MRMIPPQPPLFDETLFSWCARLADFHAAMSCQDWLKMMEISQNSVINHDPACVTRLAALTGFSTSRVMACGLQRLGDRSYRHGDETFSPFFALRTQTTYCPACLLEDRDPTGPSAGQRVGRLSWVFNPVRTCPRHGTLLQRRPQAGYREKFQDMNLVAPDDQQLESLAHHAEGRSVSELQRYVQMRFDNGCGSAWVDRQRIDQTAKACEMLGAVLEFGAHADFDKLTLAQWDDAGNTGFEAARAGEHGIRCAFEKVASNSMRDHKTGGPQALYGRLYQWLQFNKSKSDPGPIRDVLRAHILDTVPVAAGTRLFGQEVEKRRRHSLVSLSRATGLHFNTLKHVLSSAGFLAGSDAKKVGEWASFDAEKSEAFAHRLLNTIPVTKIPAYINCNRTQAEMLVREGIIPKLIPDGQRSGRTLLQVATADLDAFLCRLRATGQPVEIPSAGMMDTIAASEIARETVADIVQLLLDGRLSRIEIVSEDLKFRSVLVDPKEVRRAAEEVDDACGLSAAEVAKRLGILKSGVSHLRGTRDPDGDPFLPVIEIPNARGTIRYRFSEDAVARFAAHHVSLTDLAKERGLSSKAMASRLRGQNIEPIKPRTCLGAAIYRRADL